MGYESECPVCRERRDFSIDTVVGEPAVCLECGTQLQVISVQPLWVDVAPHQGECWGE